MIIIDREELEAINGIYESMKFMNELSERMYETLGESNKSVSRLLSANERLYGACVKMRYALELFADKQNTWGEDSHEYARIVLDEVKDTLDAVGYIRTEVRR